MGAALLLAACAPATPPAAPPETVQDAPKQEAAADALDMKGIQLHLYAAAAVPGQERSPAFSVEAEGFSQDETRTWRFTGARATVHPRKQGDAPVVFMAATGRLREEESALLEGGVTTQIGPMTVAMERVEWLQGEPGSGGLASSDSPVTISDPAMRLFAQQFRMYPDDGSFTLYDVQGEVAFTPPAEAVETAVPTEGEVSPS